MAEAGNTETTDEHYTWERVMRIVREHRRELVWANVIAMLAVLVSVPLPLMMPLLVDEVLLKEPATLVSTMNRLFPEGWHGPVLYITAILLATIAMRFASVIFTVWQLREFSFISKDVVFRIRRDLLLRLQRISLAEYEAMGSGEVTSHFVTDLNAIDTFIGMSVSKFLIAVLSLIGAAGVLLWMHWKLALLILFLNPVVVYFTVSLGKQVKQLKRRENQAFEVFQGALTETLDAIQQIRASNREGYYLKRVIERARQIKHDSAAFSWKSDAASRLSFFVFLVGFDLFRAVSMLMVLYSGLSIGEMMAVFAYLWFMMGPVQEVLNIQYAFYSARAALERINSLLDLREEPRYPTERNPFKGRRGVSVQADNIHFSYRPDEPVLNGVSLNIEAGQRVALVGASGGGKSTLVQVLLGLYQPQQGQICFDGVPVRKIGLEVVREHVATVLQHPVLFNDTVRNNLTLGRDYPDESLWEALRAAQMEDVVRDMPQQLDSQLGRQGVRLSGGQRQRLAIARLLLNDPQVVIFDEATSALDTETEARLHEALKPFLEGRTVLIIAHRLSAVKQADHVYVFENGQIAEQGTHGELLRSDGLYSRLYG
ncbi:ATP-binding cassette subfamily C protein [Thiogranum longum]|uniref:ATP-binding cassette subfamily C protein n=1 Tax=Thiogranum longum TaxID=1537524 RepID=A0A4R1HBQ5_9GAMM|nr:ABC transporter ATP-binding protein [Thiogranum longum]TCK17610.1 ATP-binding cassette subfamily C protein [Thiogranum longum]